MPKKCVLVVLDGLGDRAFAALGHRTPLQAARTPHLDALAVAGSCGLYHASALGRALPSENAHFAMFGYDQAEFPGRGLIEALGLGLDPGPGEVAVLAHFCSVVEVQGCLSLFRDRPPLPDAADIAALFEAVREYAAHGLTIRLAPDKGLFGVLLVSGPEGQTDPRVTDTNPMIDGRPLSALLPHAGAGQAAARTARALGAYLVYAHKTLSAHPVNRARQKAGLPPINAVVTQRAGAARPIEPFAARTGMKALSISSGAVYQGLCRYLGMDALKVRDTDDPGADLAERLRLARENLRAYDFIHVHSKAPDEAAHKKDPLLKKTVIEALDAGFGLTAGPLTDDPEVVLAVTADHSTPSGGELVHSGEPVPLVLVGQGARRDAVTRFDEVAAASGALSLVRGKELLYVLMNACDRIVLDGIRDTPEARLYWPGDYQPFRTNDHAP